MRKLLKQFIKNQHGGPAIEFGLMVGFIAVALPALIDITTMINSYMKLASGMRSGEQYALKYPADNVGIALAIASASGLPAQNVTTNVSQFCECSGLSNACNNNCSNGAQFAKFDQINVSYDISSKYIYQNINLYPQTIAKTVAIRIQ